MSYKKLADVEELGIKSVVQDSLGMWLVIDKLEDSQQILLIPFSWDHRRLVDRSEL